MSLDYGLGTMTAITLFSMVKVKYNEHSAWSPLHEDFIPYIDITCYIMYGWHNMDSVKWKRAFDNVQNVRIQIILRMRKVSSGPLFSIHTFCSIQ